MCLSDYILIDMSEFSLMHQKNQKIYMCLSVAQLGSLDPQDKVNLGPYNHLGIFLNSDTI